MGMFRIPNPYDSYERFDKHTPLTPAEEAISYSSPSRRITPDVAANKPATEVAKNIQELQERRPQERRTANPATRSSETGRTTASANRTDTASQPKREGNKKRNRRKRPR
jgi:hypothetical protein